MQALHTAATGMDAQLKNIDAIANNIANLNTDGFRRDRVNFADLFYSQQSLVGAPLADGSPRPTGIHIGHGVRVVSTQKIFSPGGIIQTDNDLNMAIQGDGNLFFAVKKPDGTLAYTRAGNFTLDSEGRVATPSGGLLEPEVTIPQEAISISISPDGIVSILDGQDPEAQQVGERITLTRFVNPGGLRPDGDNLFTATAAAGEPQVVNPGEQGAGTLLQHALEGSNVNAITQLIQLIQGQRAYEINSNVVKTADEALQVANNLRR